MVAFMVAAWYCYVRAQAQPLWGVLAAACALLAYFTKAAAIFFVAALGIEALLILIRPTTADTEASRKAAVATLAGLTACGIVALAVFVVPNWTEYRFYNWQMSVTRKPSYDVRSLLNRVTWFPIVHDIFTRMWFTVVVGVLASFGALGRWRTVAPPERVLVLWIGLGAVELLLHDVGNERRFVFFIPALVALASLMLARDRRILPSELSTVSRQQLLIGLPVVVYGIYVLGGSAGAAGIPVRARAGRSPLARRSPWPAPSWSTSRGRGYRVPVGSAMDSRRRVARGRARLGRPARTVRAVGPRENLQELPRLGRARHGAAAWNARPRQARQRALPREPHQANLRWTRVWQLRGQEAARRCAVYFDLRCSRTSGTKEPSFETCSRPTPIAQSSGRSTSRNPAAGHDRAVLIDKFGGKSADRPAPPAALRLPPRRVQEPVATSRAHN